MAKNPRVGDRAPDITLLDQDGTTQSLADQRGKWVLVYFYPRDDTPGCTVEACGLRDSAARYEERDIQVFGISADSVKSHRKFADKHQLPFTLLADEEKTVIRSYGAWGKKKFMGREFDGILRQSFLVDPQGKVAQVYAQVKPEQHAEEVLADVARLASGQALTPATKTVAKTGKTTSQAKAKSARAAPKASKKA